MSGTNKKFCHQSDFATVSHTLQYQPSEDEAYIYCARIGDRLLKGDGGHQTGKRQRIWDVGAEFIAGQPHTADSKNLNITDLTEVLIQRKLGC